MAGLAAAAAAALGAAAGALGAGAPAAAGPLPAPFETVLVRRMPRTPAGGAALAGPGGAAALLPPATRSTLLRSCKLMRVAVLRLPAAVGPAAEAMGPERSALRVALTAVGAAAAGAAVAAAISAASWHAQQVQGTTEQLGQPPLPPCIAWRQGAPGRCGAAPPAYLEPDTRLASVLAVGWCSLLATALSRARLRAASDEGAGNAAAAGASGAPA
jgi:hypothetical protein